MTYVDLHTHSTYSDGLLTPDALCALAVRKHVTLLALCDHDTTEGLVHMAEAVRAQAERGASLALIPGVELSAGADGRTHILGYGVRADATPLNDALAALRAKRAARGGQMVAALAAMGVQVPPALVPKAQAGGMAIGRPHLARALIRMGLVSTVEQAFARYLGEGRPAYVPLAHFSAAEAIALLGACGALPVLAHPARLHMPAQTLEALVASLKGVGLMGLEVYHPSASRGDVRQLAAMALRHGLLVTGGSDFHGDAGSRARLGGLPAGWRHCEADVEALQAAVAQASAVYATLGAPA